MNKLFEHTIDYTKVGEGLGLTADEARKFLNDGRIIGRLAEFILAKRTSSKRAKSEKSAYDVDGENGERIEVRCITDQLSFASSKEIGSGRKVTQAGFEEKLNSLDYFVAVDKRAVDSLNFIRIDKVDIDDMISDGTLRKNKSVNAKKLYRRIDKI